MLCPPCRRRSGAEGMEGRVMVIFEGSLAGSDPVGAQNHRRRMPAVEGSLGSMGRHRRAGAPLSVALGLQRRA